MTKMRNDKPYFPIGDGSLREACPFEYEDMAVLQKQFCCVPLFLTHFPTYQVRCLVYAIALLANTMLLILYTVNSLPVGRVAQSV